MHFYSIETCDAIQFKEFVKCKSGDCKWTAKDCADRGETDCCKGSCIPKRWVNDPIHEEDCTDGSDEIGMHNFLQRKFHPKITWHILL